MVTGRNGGISMATKSILKNVVVKGNKSALNMAKALEAAQMKPVVSVPLSKKVKELSPEAIRKIWGAK